MRAGAGAMGAAAILLVACTAGNRTGDRVVTPAPSSAAPSTRAAPPATAGGSATTVPADPVADDLPGSLTLHVHGLTLPGGTALRVVVGVASPRVTVRRKGSGGELAACPVVGPTDRVDPARCLDLAAARQVDLEGGRGMEIQARLGGAVVEEVALTYLPADRSMTVVTPARPPSSCGATACEATFSLTPARPGPFHLDAIAAGGRPQLTLRAELPGGASRVLATAEGGAALSITATLEPAAEAVLLYRELVDGAVAPLRMEMYWP